MINLKHLNYIGTPATPPRKNAKRPSHGILSLGTSPAALTPGRSTTERRRGCRALPERVTMTSGVAGGVGLVGANGKATKNPKKPVGFWGGTPKKKMSKKKQEKYVGFVVGLGGENNKQNNCVCLLFEVLKKWRSVAL